MADKKCWRTIGPNTPPGRADQCIGDDCKGWDSICKGDGQAEEITITGDICPTCGLAKHYVGFSNCPSGFHSFSSSGRYY